MTTSSPAPQEPDFRTNLCDVLTVVVGSLNEPQHPYYNNLYFHCIVVDNNCTVITSVMICFVIVLGHSNFEWVLWETIIYCVLVVTTIICRTVAVDHMN